MFTTKNRHQKAGAIDHCMKPTDDHVSWWRRSCKTTQLIKWETLCWLSYHRRQCTTYRPDWCASQPTSSLTAGSPDHPNDLPFLRINRKHNHRLASCACARHTSTKFAAILTTRSTDAIKITLSEAAVYLGQRRGRLHAAKFIGVRVPFLSVLPSSLQTVLHTSPKLPPKLLTPKLEIWNCWH